ncbi:MAG: hypothetical protein JST75_12240 [Bacteroidetes bacterium]|nr:hypothetical protein [Bacteroidota bacterium]
MSLKLKSLLFINSLTFEINHPQQCILRAVLKDDSGLVCSALEKEIISGQQMINWDGLDELPYGEYTLEVSKGVDEIKMKLVKRI